MLSQFNHTLAILFCMLSSIVMNNCLAKENNVRLRINDYYYDARFEQCFNTFESPGREVFDKKETILQTLQIMPGMKIADIGAGTSLYTIPFAKQVGKKGLAQDSINLAFICNTYHHFEYPITTLNLFIKH
ncbi:MAG: protein-L-isoaspartate O-methyltransferase [gamma proteobacterium symbiont of Taylorina sp.]|nr:protein-L-isoaspartate O-methyltransferase [gamma proteobacterium symbiont of Taylorina sp.]